MTGRIQSSDIEFKILPLSEEDQDLLKSFSCGCKELDNFFHNEVFICTKYCYVSSFCAKNNDGEIIALFTLANDSIVLDSSYEKNDFLIDVSDYINEEYQFIFGKQSSFPAINIGHLAVRSDYQCKHIGKDILDFVTATFSDYKIAGCQFITVDSLNNPRTNKFYMTNGFCLQTDNDSTLPTRRMYLPINL
ncbi:GNAT family N-acetyltransferase [Parabacteroides sp.]